jgi:hypothetical protein
MYQGNIMQTIEVLKKNRKYFNTRVGKYTCKLLIDVNSENLEIGEYTLELEDISIVTKYGKNLIFKLAASIEDQEKVGICTLKTDYYNPCLVNRCHKLGGKFDKSVKAWVFSGFVADQVEELDVIYNSVPIDIELYAVDNIETCRNPVRFLGIEIAVAKGRDTGAHPPEGVAFIQGDCTSGGSRINWDTIILKDSVIRLSVPSQLLKEALKQAKELDEVLYTHQLNKFKLRFL